MLIQIGENDWVESGEIEYVGPISQWWWPKKGEWGGSKPWWNNDDKPKWGEGHRYTCTKIKTRRGDYYTVLVHPQKFAQYLEECGVTMLGMSKGLLHDVEKL